MPKLACPCGHIHDLTPIPDEGWITVKDKDYEALISAHVVQHDISGTSLPSGTHPRVSEWDAASQVLHDTTGTLYECPECKRIMWKKPSSEKYEIYSRDTV